MTEPPCLILFARSPEHAKVKTRLAATLGYDKALDLYRRMLSRQISLVNSFTGVNRQCWITGDMSHPDLQAFAGERFTQQGTDLGERMHLALVHALAGSPAAVLIGCDCPGIDTDYLAQAFAALAEGIDVVLGPATDGGYVLVGMRFSNAAMFSGIEWGTPRVLEQTRKQLQTDNISWKELPPLTDIDVPEDLEVLRELVNQEYGYFVESTCI